MTADVLEVLDQHAAQIRMSGRAVAAARALAAILQNIEVSRYDRERTKEECDSARRHCASELLAALDEYRHEAEHERHDALVEFDRAAGQRASDRRETKDVVDAAALREATDVGELLAALADGERAGEVVGEQVRKIVAARLKELAATEQRTNKINGPAFSAWCKVSRPGARSTRDAIDGEAEMRTRRARDLITQIANAAGVSHEFSAVERTAMTPRKTMTGPLPKSSITIGRYWDLIQEAKR